ncbi:chalcone isomerase family protein [Flavobacterium petrolei]|uniref:chalcone isomerase family protein n=1 Tax=Flavobacterium petrolei TaxID=2259594 RepID=UPI0037568AF0
MTSKKINDSFAEIYISYTMKNLLLLFLFVLSMQVSHVSAQKQIEVEGVVLPRTIDFKQRQLMLNGVGIRSKMWVDVYVQALYLSELSQDAERIIESNSEMAIRLQITSSMVTSDKLSKSLNKGLVKSIGDGNLANFKSQIAMLESLLNKEKTVKDDAFNLIYNSADESLWVFKNDRYEGKIPGFEFKKLFFGIWLSNKPVDEKLKNDLLGKS